ncbi:translation elongation factor Ts [Fervidobacterium sp.]
MEISAQMVKELRERTGAGMMDCKNALAEANGDVEKAIEILRKKGLAKAAKKAGRETNEGLIISYVHHNGKLGVLVELNCETDFVARTDDFKELGNKIAMHIAAMAPRWVKREDVPADIIEKEREIYREQLKDSGKPTQVIEKIIEGKLESFYQDNCLVEQKFALDQSITIKDMIQQAIAKIGENIQVSRFVRMQIGE